MKQEFHRDLFQIYSLSPHVPSSSNTTLDRKDALLEPKP